MVVVMRGGQMVGHAPVVPGQDAGPARGGRRRHVVAVADRRARDQGRLLDAAALALFVAVLTVLGLVFPAGDPLLHGSRRGVAVAARGGVRITAAASYEYKRRLSR